MLLSPGATPHWGTTVQLLARARLLRRNGSLAVYDMSTMLLPASMAVLMSSKPIFPGSAPQTISASPISFWRSAFSARVALTVSTFAYGFWGVLLARFAVAARQRV